ncbi:MAG: GNAT family N-acetyltransferase [Actinobacteria bacterium]|nr:GNAT family N-acetyltransferase [Actinomycetota bacterium]
MAPVELRTSRLALRAPGADDIDAITAICQDPEIARWTTVPSPYSRADAEEFVHLVAQWWADGSETVWCAYVDGELIAALGLHRITRHDAGGDAELGYWVAASARGKGYLTEAARAVIDWAFAELDLVRIVWRAVIGNVASARSARALGFRFEGSARQALTGPRGRDDCWCAGLLRDDDRAPVPWPLELG